MQPTLGDLINAVRDSLPEIPKPRNGANLRTTWPRPPLLIPEDVELQGIALNEFARPKLNVSSTQYRTIFEEYVDRFFAQAADATTSSKWLTEKLKLNPKLSDWYFPEGVQDAPVMRNLTTLLWLASYSEAAGEFEVTATSVTVSLDGVIVGLRDGLLISRFNPIQTGLTDSPRLLMETHHKVGKPSTSNEKGLCAFWIATHSIDEPLLMSKVQIALCLLYYRYSRNDRLADYLYKGFEKRLKGPATLQLRPIARSLMGHLTRVPNPAPVMRSELVREGLMDLVEFNEKFRGVSHFTNLEATVPVGLEYIDAWNETLRKIVKGLKQ